MADIQQLFSFLSYFENTERNFAEIIPQEEIDGETIPGFIQYDEPIVEFAKLYGDLALRKGDYVDYIQEFLARSPSVAEWKQQIKQADRETIQSFLTYFTRKEQFTDGQMKWASENGIIYELLQQLKKME